MKRLLCVLLILFLVPAVCLADLFQEFNLYASTFSAPDLLFDKPVRKDDYQFYKKGNCIITFKGEERIIVEGDGDDFAIYCLAAIMAFDSGGKYVLENAGIFFPEYIICRCGLGKEMAFSTAAGNSFVIIKQDSSYVFTVSGK